MRKYSRRSLVRTHRASFLWMGAFILCSALLVSLMGWYWVGSILGAYLMLAFASVLLRGRPED